MGDTTVHAYPGPPADQSGNRTRHREKTFRRVFCINPQFNGGRGTGGVVILSGNPWATRSCSLTRSRPLVSSVIGCSTCKRVLTSRNDNTPLAPQQNSLPCLRCGNRHAGKMDCAALAICASISALRKGAGASTSFGCGVAESSRGYPPRLRKPCSSAITCASIWRGRSRYCST